MIQSLATLNKDFFIIIIFLTNLYENNIFNNENKYLL